MHLAQNKIFCLMGQTAVGKTQIAIKLTEIFPFDVISVDSGMVYRGMDIGTAKPTLEELKKTPHRLVDICDPTEIYSAGSFRQDALTEINASFNRGKIPLLVGGTMLYFYLLQYGISNLPVSDKKIREKIAAKYKEQGLEALYQYLEQIDPQFAKTISKNDSQRISRALEVFELTGKRLSDLKEHSPPQKLPYNIVNIALIHSDKDCLQNRINGRFEKMLRLGFVEEVERLYKRGDLTCDLPSMRLLGYKQIWQYFLGKINYQQMIEQVQIATRQFAKRQKTWLNRFEEVNLFANSNNKDKLLLETIKLIDTQLRLV